MDEIKQCSKCKQTKPISEFGKHCRCKNGIRCSCKECENAYYYETRERFKPRIYAFYKNNRKEYQARHWRNKVKRIYGISADEYKKMLLEQNERCAICFKHQSELNHKMCVDHNHKTNKNRGLLCRKCNVAIGNLNENIAHLQAAITYLKRFEEVTV